ncbi:nucleotide sugar dehydrogenase [Cytobacillus oceanisediminis]|uniref:nucleotide sugar dehydrogenase n=1 Tax=Cytobacillus oceanisediminis TaxID=665099 RepID=UPI001C222FC6|nr:nucleotide sugar dehydrogenase [Cytobacillus oceanisediminis]MBU8772087.1 nucleotide sugar dehydrogenase [Cytobacillus oceanisediminis]
MKPIISIVGLGYVGLTLAAMLLDRGFIVQGVEINKDVRESLSKGEIPFKEPGIGNIIKKCVGHTFFIQKEVPVDSNVYFVCVATPYDNMLDKPNLEALKVAVTQIAKRKNNDSLVVIRSTVPVGTSRSELLPILEAYHQNPRLAFAPERTIQGKAFEEVCVLPQIIGAFNDQSLQQATSLFSQAGLKTVTVSSLEVAELTKLICNSYTDLIYGYGNEIAGIAETLGLDAHEIIDAANMDYPRPKIFKPGHVGGSCLTKDPYHLKYALEKKGYVPTLIAEARQLNERLVNRIIGRVEQRFNNLGLEMSQVNTFISGFAYKGIPETSDLRGAIVNDLVPLLFEKGIKNIKGHDFVVDKSIITQYKVNPVDLEEGIANAQVIFILNNHHKYTQFNLEQSLKNNNNDVILFDLWGVFRERTSIFEKYKNVTYIGVGF